MDHDVIDVTTETAVQTAPMQAAPLALTPMEMVSRAVSTGAGMDVIEKLMALQERWDANQARKAFDNAMALAKAEMPVVIKNRVVDFTSSKGRTHYRHEDLAGIAKTVAPTLAKHGLSYRFRTTSNLNEPIYVTCIVSHREGHSEENTLCAGRDDTGNKNNIQQVGSTLTYLQRMTLKAALGLAASEDDDGRAAGDIANTISQDQIGSLIELLDSTNSDRVRFLKYFRVEALGDLPASRFQEAITMLNAKGPRQ